MNKAGELSLIIGGMFSGKSTELQRQGRRHELAGRSVVYFKPKKDTRYTKGAISTHDGNDVLAHYVGRSQDILNVVEPREVNVVCIDEVQFLDSDIVQVIEHLLRQGIDVVASGLDLDRFGEPFGMVPVIAMKAEKLVKLNAVCSCCGDDAWVSSGRFKSDSQVEVGEKDMYQPMCRSCYYKQGNLL